MATTDSREVICADCGDGSVELIRHHISYELDLVILVCRSCHVSIHHDESHPLYPIDSGGKTIHVEHATRRRLMDLGDMNETYDEILTRLLELYEATAEV